MKSSSTVIITIVLLFGFFFALQGPVLSIDLQGTLDGHDPKADSQADKVDLGVDRLTNTAPSDVESMQKMQNELTDLIKILEKIIASLESENRTPAGADVATQTTTVKKPSTTAPTGLESKTSLGTVKVNTSLNIRQSPWGPIIGSFHNGDQVKILAKEGDWYKILRNGDIAYVHSNYVETSGQSAGQTPVVTPGATPDTTTTPAPVASTGSGNFGSAPCSPMPSRTSSEYGPRNMSHSSYHYGIDLPVANGTRLNALGDGVVTASGFESGGGKYIKVRYDNGYESFYCHLQSYSFKAGQRVSKGQQIASSDNTGQWTTGPHLHMGIKKNGKYVNPRSVPGLPLPPRR